MDIIKILWLRNQRMVRVGDKAERRIPDLVLEKGSGKEVGNLGRKTWKICGRIKSAGCYHNIVGNDV
jgi:hypothetical protein